MRKLHAHRSAGERAGRGAFYIYCALVFAFLMMPILAVVPLSFNAGAFLTYPLQGFSLRWYRDFFASPEWLASLRNSLVIALSTTAIATPLGTLAALGLVRMRSALRPLIYGLFVLPMIAPVIVIAVAVYFLYAPNGLANSFLGLILAHITLATPFVVITVDASLKGFDTALLRAGASLGAPPHYVFRRVLLPLIAPGVAAGAVFAFMTSFDEIVIAIFIAGPQQQTLPLQMFDGVREQISPTITVAATLLAVASASLLGVVEMLRRKTRRLRSPLNS